MVENFLKKNLKWTLYKFVYLIGAICIIEALLFVFRNRAFPLVSLLPYRFYFYLLALCIFIFSFLRYYVKNAQALFRVLYENNSASVIIWRPDGTVVDMNKCYMDTFGFDETLIGKNWLDHGLSEEDDFELESFTDMIFKEKVNHNNITKSNTVDNIDLDMVWSDYYLQDLDVIVSFGVDITDKLEAERTILRMNSTDVLTGLPNMSRFQMDINELLNDGWAGTVFCLDIDNFRRLNEFHSYYYGDKLIKVLAKYLEEHFDHTYRWERDKFFVVTGDDPASIAERILQISSGPMYLDELEYTVIINLGSVNGTEVTGIDDTISKLILAYKEAGEIQGSAYVPYDEALLHKVNEDKRKESLLKKAINESKFQLFLQPIVDMKTACYSSCEVLLRLDMEMGSFVSIGDIIDFAEETGQIRMIDQLVIDRTFSYIAPCEDMDENFYFSINISAQSFAAPWFVGYVEERAQYYDIHTSNIAFEITEYVMLEEIESAKETMMQLQALGFKINLDDFGTEYSSINYLSQLPFDIFKIDRSYVSQLEKEDSMVFVVETLINLASQLGMEVVAEGIETEAQHSLLKNLNCHYAQGYYYCRPGPFEEIRQRINAQRVSNKACGK